MVRASEARRLPGDHGNPERFPNLPRWCAASEARRLPRDHGT